MGELIQEHIQARMMVKKLEDAKNSSQQGNPKAFDDIAAQITALVEFYPPHIDKEDNHFFRPCMDFFTEDERSAMLLEFDEFDKELIHKKYKELVETIEKTRS
jgi:hemerythrin-like domain-containing protein